MASIDSLTSPAVLVDGARLKRNIRRMQERADREEVALRPHVKTHKSPAIAARQIESGAAGLTVATVSEAEAFVEAGFEDVRLATPVAGPRTHRRLAALARRARISFTVDGEPGLRASSEHHDDAPIEVLLEIDTGHHRCGVRWDGERELVRLARLAKELPGTELAGILTHAGHAYAGPADGESREEALDRVATEERDRMLAAAAVLREAGCVPPDERPADAPFEISVGSTPTARRFSNRSVEGAQITEIRPGNYVFNDGMQVALGAADLEDCALTVHTRVVSARREGPRERVVLDAGTKVLTTDRGYGTTGFGTVLYNAATMRPHPHARVERLSEEHAWVTVPGGSTFHVGDPVRILPHHACVTAATQDELYLIDEENRAEPVRVRARGHRPLPDAERAGTPSDR